MPTPNLEEILKLFQETDRKFKDIRHRIDQLSQKWDEQWGRFGNRSGEFVANMIAPVMIRLFQERQIEVHQLYRGLQGERDGNYFEADLVVSNDQDVVVIEVKSKLSLDDVNEHLLRLEKFRSVFHHFAHTRLMGAVATIVISDEVEQYAYQKGLFVIGQTGEIIKILNPIQFVPRVW